MLLLVRHNHCPQYLCHNHQAVDQHDDHWSITMIANCGGRCIYWRSKAAGWPSASWSQCWCREGFCFWAALLRLRFPFLVGLILQIHLMMTCDDADRWWLGDGYSSFSDFIFLPLAGTIEVNLTSNLISPERLEWTQPLMLQLALLVFSSFIALKELSTSTNSSNFDRLSEFYGPKRRPKIWKRLLHAGLSRRMDKLLACKWGSENSFHRNQLQSGLQTVWARQQCSDLQTKKAACQQDNVPPHTATPITPHHKLPHHTQCMSTRQCARPRHCLQYKSYTMIIITTSIIIAIIIIIIFNDSLPSWPL